MKPCIKYFFVLVYLLLLPICQGVAQERTFDRKKWKEITRDLNYTEKKEKEPPPKEQSSRPQWNMPSLSIESEAIKTILFVMLISVLATFIIWALMQRPEALPQADNSSLLWEEEPNVKEIQVDAFKENLQKLLSEKDYRRALRVFYLLMLKLMDDKDLIEWKIEKTNADYLADLSEQEFISDFRQITLTYEKVWYGEKKYSEATMMDFIQIFESFSQELEKEEVENAE
ncbi:MAG: DUF4129 domain-containing protein [Bacteroidota bacterium]